MSIAEQITQQITQLKTDFDEVYEAGYEKGKAEGGDTTEAYNQGVADGKQAEYDRFWDEFQRNGTRTNYRHSFSGVNFNVEKLNPKYIPIVPTGSNAAYMFHNNTYTYPNRADYTEICKKLDFSQITNADSLFHNVTGENITVDLSNCETASNAFNCNSGGDIDKLTIKVTEKLTSASQFFYYNSDLETLTFTDDSVIAFAIYLARSPKLTHESLMSVINALKDYTGTSTTKTATLGTTNLEKLTVAEKAIATQKGWTLA